MRYPAAIPTIALAAGIACGIFFYTPSNICLPLVAASLIAAVFAFITKRQRIFIAAIVCGFAAVGMIFGREANAAALQTPLGVFFDRHVGPLEYQLLANIEGTLRSDAALGPNGVTLSMNAEWIEFETRRESTAGGVIIGIGGELGSDRVGEWRRGRRIRLPVTLHKPAKYLNAGVPDSVRDFGWKGTSLVGSTKSDTLVDVIAPGNWLSERLASARAAVRDAVTMTVSPWNPQSAAVVTAILIGDRAGLDDELQRQLQEAGTYHVIAISGGNIAILAALCVLLLKLFAVGPRASAVVIATLLIAYAMVVGGGSSVWRATLMAAIYFAAQFGDHRSSAANVAAISALILFCANPLEVVDASFALTFGATIGLIVGMPMLKRPPSMPGWIYAPLALLAASVCAEIALLPIAALVFSRVTGAGLVLNFAAIPLMTVVQIAGMAAVALAHVSSRAGLLAGFVAHLGVRGLLVSASLVELAPWIARRVPPPALFVIAAYYTALIVALRFRQARRISIAVVVLSGWWIVTAPVIAIGARPLRVTFVDVGQGDAAVVQFPDGRSLSVDSGGIANSTFDIGSRVLAPVIWSAGIRRLDYLSVTHGDPDHIGGAISLFRDFRPAEIWYGVPVPPHEPTRRLRQLADAAGVPWRTLLSGDRLEIGDVQLVVHHPPAPDWERQRVRNDDSEVVEIIYGGVSFVFTGDIGRETEQAIASSFGQAPIRILKVPHHGSATSSSSEFLRALRPAIAVISAGRGNPFGHPVPAVVDRYREIGAAIFRTDLDGAVTVETDGKTVHVHTFMNRQLTLRTHGR